MIPSVYPSSRVQSERTIAIARVVLAGTSLFAVWLDPADPAQYAHLTWVLYWIYVSWAALLAFASIWRESGDWLPFLSHTIDIFAFAVFQYFTLGPSSPFFVFFVFSMFCGAIRWGWRGTLITGATVMALYVGMAEWIGSNLGESSFQLNRFVIRLAYLGVATWMLVYLGQYEARLRTEIERLARWPAPLASDGAKAIGRVLEYAASLMQAGRVLVFWEVGDEPVLHEAQWTAGEVSLQRHAPDTITLVTGDHLSRATFLLTGDVRQATSTLVLDPSGRLVRESGVPLSPEVMQRLGTNGLATAAFRTDAVAGRLFLSDISTPTEAVALTEAVAREIASSLDQLHAAEQRQEIATREQRIRVARDLHDGVLQALTGVRLELRAIANSRPDSPESLRQQLGSLERAIAMEQRELRFFISDLEPTGERRINGHSNLALRLDSVRERLALEWKTPVTLRLSPRVAALPENIEDAIPLMVHEAAVNALKHAQPSRVSVDVDADAGRVRVAVTDDGHGFPFRGHYTHASLAASHSAPRSLFDRVSALGGQLSIDSTERGSRVEMVLSL